MNDLVLTGATIATMTDGYGLVPHGAVAVTDGLITWVGNSEDAPPAERTSDLGGRLLTPGLMDSHTHLVFGGDRAVEFEQRLGGASYEEISRAGGGIVSTVTATRASTTAELAASAQRRLQWLAGGGVTTVEVKTGYGLDVETELRMLDVIGALEGPAVIPTLLAHTVPPDRTGDRDGFVTEVCEQLIPMAAKRVQAVDVFCERIAFSATETRRLLEAASAHGLRVKLHADQLSLGEGCHLAAEFGALSADHLEHADESAVKALARSATVAVLIPGASSFLDEPARPPIDLLRHHSVRMAVATDLNPGTAPMGAPTLAMHLACTRLGLTPEEALVGMTVNAAAALGLGDRGAIAPGMRADVAVWDVSHPAELSYWMAAPLCAGTWIEGRPLHQFDAVRDAGSDNPQEERT